MPELSIITQFKQSDLAEESQKLPITFSVLSKTGPNQLTELTPFVKCREFFQDMALGIHMYKLGLDRTTGIYGYYISPKELNKVNLNQFYLAIQAPKIQKCSTYIAALVALARKEYMGIARKPLFVKRKSNVIIMRISQLEGTNPLVLGALTWMIRVGYGLHTKDQHPTDWLTFVKQALDHHAVMCSNDVSALRVVGNGGTYTPDLQPKTGADNIRAHMKFIATVSINPDKAVMEKCCTSRMHSMGWVNISSPVVKKQLNTKDESSQWTTYYTL